MLQTQVKKIVSEGEGEYGVQTISENEPQESDISNEIPSEIDSVSISDQEDAEIIGGLSNYIKDLSQNSMIDRIENGKRNKPNNPLLSSEEEDENENEDIKESNDNHRTGNHPLLSEDEKEDPDQIKV